MRHIRQTICRQSTTTISARDGTDLDPDKKAEYLAEHFEMNAYRDHAKTVANELLAYAQEHNL